MKKFKEFLREEADTLSQPQIDTKTNNQMNNDSFVTSVSSNNTSVKNSLKSDIPTPDNYDEIERLFQSWLKNQMREWENANPYPKFEEGMTLQHYQEMCLIWETAQYQHMVHLYNSYTWHIFGGETPSLYPKNQKPNEVSDSDWVTGREIS